MCRMFLTRVLAAAVTSAIPSLLTAQTDSVAGIPAELLDEVVVTAKIPAVRVTSGKTVYSMKSTVMGQVGTLVDAISSVPGVNVSDGGTVSLYGNNGARVVIDGKSVYLKGTELVNYLRSIPASTVSTIALRTTANARDDASDKAGVIEIVTAGTREHGLTVGTNGTVSAGRNLRGNGGVNAAYNVGRSEFSMSYSLYAGRQRTRLDIDRYYLRDEDRMLQLSTRRRSDNNHVVKGAWNYAVTEDTKAGIAADISRNCRNERGRMDGYIPVLDEHERSDNYNRQRWHSLMADAYVSHRFGSGGRLDAGFNTFHFRTSERQMLEASSDDSISSTVRGRIGWYILHADYSRQLGKGWKLDAGMKSTFVRIRNRGAYSRLEAGEWLPDENLSSGFSYRANTNALYAQLSYGRGGFGVTAGLRMEHERLRSAFSGNEVAADTCCRVSTLDLVPTVELKYALSERVALMLAYSRRVERPNYFDLNPFIYIFDEYTHAGGNIKLHSSTSDNVQLGVAVGGRLQGALFLTRSDDAIMKAYHEISDKCVYVASENLPYYLQAGLRLVLAELPIGQRWAVTLTAVGMYRRYDWFDGPERKSTRSYSPILQFDNRFDLGAGWSAELKGAYNGRMAHGQVMVRPFGNVDVGLRKKLFGGKVSLSVFAKDIFATQLVGTDIALGGHDASFKENEYKRQIGVSFSLKLHSGRKKASYQERKGPSELDRL